MKRAKPVASPTTQEVLTLKQAADLLQLHSETVSKYATSGELPGRRIGPEWRFRRSDLLNWISHGNQAPKAS